MLSTRWQPWAEIERLRGEMDRLFGAGSRSQPARFGESAYPPLNLWEDAENLYAEAELPGFELNDLELYVSGGRELTIKGQRKQPELKGGTRHRQERAYGSFSRTVELPSDIDGEQVSAQLQHGILTVKLPKLAEVKPRRIEVKTG
jgi:HSP20 family protein